MTSGWVGLIGSVDWKVKHQINSALANLFLSSEIFYWVFFIITCLKKKLITVQRWISMFLLNMNRFFTYWIFLFSMKGIEGKIAKYEIYKKLNTLKTLNVILKKPPFKNQKTTRKLDNNFFIILWAQLLKFNTISKKS